MDSAKHNEVSQRAYEIWEAEGRPHGHHDAHWRQAEQELGVSHASGAVDPHPGMMGDGTEEQNLNQVGTPAARITQEEVEEAFASVKAA
ncbi:DUF2934 domain-containing protein [Lichenifustis flavocetrariae]|uniref:DUF2934 domain-containing protein n=1 Tax=Lichenifustis flavocetrariae TaxID=2949735 RepID=A0AA41YWB6_9HYPH|nr:DUF2934 domain-containing protein [Lichenifustis flavocetrariae]MCW6508173.1 DUF2934 domain-containing protein [Lichenifustis flavocetrariae]